MNKDLNYYNILNVKFGFDKLQIKNNYRSLSKKHHPDKNGGDDKNFKIISEAYKILTNIKLKEIYDKESKYGDNYDPLLELLNFEFSNSNKSSDIIYDKMKSYKKDEMLHIVLEYDEIPEVISYIRNVVCSSCEGTSNGSVSSLNLKGKMGNLFSGDEIPCDICESTGSYNSSECPGCKGNGYMKIGLSKCSGCEGKGIIEKKKTIDSIKEKDFINGKLKIKHFGNQSKYNGSTGTLYIIIKSLIEE